LIDYIKVCPYFYIPMTKQELRIFYFGKRKELTKSEVEVRSKLICENFFLRIDLTLINVVHTFLPIKKNNEPDSWLIINRLKKDFPRIKISVPKVTSLTGKLLHYYLEPASSLLENPWGIPEIHEGETTRPEEIDMVLIPLLAFDLAGNRVGYGKGFYDKFLEECNPTTLRIGLSLFEGVERIDDIETYDQPLHYCITPTDVHTF
jgi:5-formyltetrahydrofolate cyclo-ligase